MFTLGAFDASVAATALTQVAAITDGSLNVQNSNLVIDRRLPQVVGAYAIGGTGLTRAQLVAPSLRAIWNPEISPIEGAALPTTPSRWLDLRFTPFPLQPEEQLSAFVTNGGAAQTAVGVWFADGPIQPVSGPIRTMRATAAATLVANVWNNGIALTFDQSFPSGRYQLVGARMFGATPWLFRLGVAGYPWKPGAIAMPTALLPEHPAFRMGGMGVWLEFTNVNTPTLDVLATAADTAQTVELDCIYLG